MQQRVRAIQTILPGGELSASCTQPIRFIACAAVAREEIERATATYGMTAQTANSGVVNPIYRELRHVLHGLNIKVVRRPLWPAFTC